MVVTSSVDAGASGGLITANGGNVSVNQTATNTLGSNVEVSAVSAAVGYQAVTKVTAVTQVNAVAAVSSVTANGVVTISDAHYNSASANSIASVSLNNYGAGSLTRSNAVTNLSLAGTAGALTRDAGIPIANTTLALNLNGLKDANTLTDSKNEIITLNVTTSGAASMLAPLPTRA